MGHVKQSKKTKAITLRLDRYWLQKLSDIARRLSLQYKTNLSAQDLIREATRRQFIAQDKRNVLKRESVIFDEIQIKF